MKKVFLLMALALLLAVNLPAVRVLSISNRKNLSERIYSRSAMARGFVISYTHSVNKGRVHDFYFPLKSGEMELSMTEFVSYGAGIPESSETEGARFRVTKNGYVIENLHRVLPRLLMAVGVVAEHSLAIPDTSEVLDTDFSKEFFLKDFFKPQTSLVFEVRRVSLVSYFMTKKI
ncbi:MAG: DUF1850 domain-containing protein [Treponema sp.]|uniref:DUF1850 domain-containing protein n=1 Tax=Treponema sp. TaxID=166 RepID=UPI0025CE43D2|nr:DUF1850 domain-containing protein [Treponema sp.]MBQ8679610.1 DUF1850 domain-containing protein [Treponema sp.]